MLIRGRFLCRSLKGFVFHLFIFPSDPNKPTDLALRDIRWRPFSFKKRYYLDIGRHLTLQENLNAERYEIWKRLFPLNWRRQTKEA